MERISALSGVIILDKPSGMTSHDAVNRVRRLYGTKQVGHTGTLDPMATGVLPIMIGRAVKASEYLTCEEKEYSALLRLGITTDTEDTGGRILSHSDTLPSEDEVKAVCASFVGEISQIPPMYSALKVGGKKLCDLARQNIEVERAPRSVTVYRLDVETMNEKEGLYALRVKCSKGTYIRTLCADIGRALSCGGAMEGLRRTASGHFTLAASHTLESLEAMTEEERCALLLPTERLFEDLPRVDLPLFYRKLISSGCAVALHKLSLQAPLGARLRLYDGQCFFALGEVTEGESGPAVKAIKQFHLYDDREKDDS